MWPTIIVLVIIVLIVAVVILVMKLKSANEVVEEKKAQEQHDAEFDFDSLDDIRRVKRKDVVSFKGAGERYEDLDVVVDRINRYEAAETEPWFEISGKCGGDRVFIEVCEDDELEVTIDSGKEYTIEDVGVTEQQLADFDAEESKSNTIGFQGKTWRYEESCEQYYFKDSKGSGEGFYAWEFSCEEDDSLVLYVEKYEGDPFIVGIARQLNPSSITVLAS